MVDLKRAARLVEAGRLDELGDDWIGRLASDPEHLDYFAGTAQLLSGNGEHEQAKFLLELVDEHLEDSGRWQTRLDLLQRCGPLYLEPASLHAAMLSTLRRVYEGCPSLEGLIHEVGLLRATEDIPKAWQKTERLRSLMQFEEGSVVWMEGKGAGRVTEVNLQLKSLKIELREHGDLRVGFAAAPKLLRPLPAHHIERRKLEDLEAIEALKRGAPGELVLVALQSHDEPLTAAQIRKALAGVVEDDEWSSWWAAARRHPQILAVGNKGRQTYSWASSEDAALGEVRRQFAQADLNGKLDLLRRNARRSPSLADEMVQQLIELASNLHGSQTAEALSIWFALERLGKTEQLDWSPSTVVGECQEPASLVAEFADRASRERLYLLCRDERRDWPAVYEHAMRLEHDPRLLTLLAERLAEEAPAGLQTRIDDVLGHPRRQPAAFVWLAENADSEVIAGDRNPLRLLRQSLDALHQSEFATYRSRLLRTFQTGGAAATLLARLSKEQAPKAEQAIARSPLDESVRDSLVQFLHARFPSLDAKRQTPLYATADSIARRRDELQVLKTEEIPANRRAIEEARAHGDLRENFEYKAARQRHEYLNSRLAALQSDLARVRTLAPESIDLKEARAGCRLELSGPDGEQRFVTILGPWESDPERGIVSYDSDLGQRLLGRAIGDRVDLDGSAWEVIAIGPWE